MYAKSAKQTSVSFPEEVGSKRKELEPRMAMATNCGTRHHFNQGGTAMSSGRARAKAIQALNRARIVTKTEPAQAMRVPCWSGTNSQRLAHARTTAVLAPSRKSTDISMYRRICRAVRTR